MFAEINNEKKTLIDKNNLDGIEEYTRCFIKIFNLRYYVSVVPYSQAVGWEDWSGDNVFFKFESVEFRGLSSYSANNSEVI